MSDTLKSLRAEVDRLTTEVTELRAWRDNHICVPAAPVVRQCTCANGTTTTYCPVHTPSNVTIWHRPTMGAAGCAGVNFTYTVPNTATAQAWQIPSGANIGAAAGGGASYVQNYTIGGECS